MFSRTFHICACVRVALGFPRRTLALPLGPVFVVLRAYVCEFLLAPVLIDRVRTRSLSAPSKNNTMEMFMFTPVPHTRTHECALLIPCRHLAPCMLDCAHTLACTPAFACALSPAAYSLSATACVCVRVRCVFGQARACAPSFESFLPQPRNVQHVSAPHNTTPRVHPAATRKKRPPPPPRAQHSCAPQTHA